MFNTTLTLKTLGRKQVRKSFTKLLKNVTLGSTTGGLIAVQTDAAVVFAVDTRKHTRISYS
jgi:hypothetical protein